MFDKVLSINPTKKSRFVSRRHSERDRALPPAARPTTPHILGPPPPELSPPVLDPIRSSALFPADFDRLFGSNPAAAPPAITPAELRHPPPSAPSPPPPRYNTTPLLASPVWPPQPDAEPKPSPTTFWPVVAQADPPHPPPRRSTAGSETAPQATVGREQPEGVSSPTPRRRLLLAGAGRSPKNTADRGPPSACSPTNQQGSYPSPFGVGDTWKPTARARPPGSCYSPLDAFLGRPPPPKGSPNSEIGERRKHGNGVGQPNAGEGLETLVDTQKKGRGYVLFNQLSIDTRASPRQKTVDRAPEPSWVDGRAAERDLQNTSGKRVGRNATDPTREQERWSQDQRVVSPVGSKPVGGKPGRIHKQHYGLPLPVSSSAVRSSSFDHSQQPPSKALTLSGNTRRRGVFIEEKEQVDIILQVEKRPGLDFQVEREDHRDKLIRKQEIEKMRARKEEEKKIDRNHEVRRGVGVVERSKDQSELLVVKKEGGEMTGLKPNCEDQKPQESRKRPIENIYVSQESTTVQAQEPQDRPARQMSGYSGSSKHSEGNNSGKSTDLSLCGTEGDKSSNSSQITRVGRNTDSCLETKQKEKISFEEVVLQPRILKRIVNELKYEDYLMRIENLNRVIKNGIKSDKLLKTIILKRYLSRFGWNEEMNENQENFDLNDLRWFYFGMIKFGLDLQKLILRREFRKTNDRKTNSFFEENKNLEKIIKKTNDDDEDEDDDYFYNIKKFLRVYNRLISLIRNRLEKNKNQIEKKLSSDEVDDQRMITLKTLMNREDLIEEFVKIGKANVYKVWVECQDSWMKDSEVLECERELWRSGIWSELRRGDICWNASLGDFGNEGKMIFDGRYLRDLSFEFDPIGHLPSWLDMLNFPASYYHRLIHNSKSKNIMIEYLNFNRLQRQHILNRIRLIKIETIKPTTIHNELINNSKEEYHYDQVGKSYNNYNNEIEENRNFGSINNNHKKIRKIQRWIYKTDFEIIINDNNNNNNNFKIETINQFWLGWVIIEIESSIEKLQEFISKIKSINQPIPFKIIRDKSRLGKIRLQLSDY